MQPFSRHRLGGDELYADDQAMHGKKEQNKKGIPSSFAQNPEECSVISVPSRCGAMRKTENGYDWECDPPSRSCVTVLDESISFKTERARKK